MPTSTLVSFGPFWQVGGGREEDLTWAQCSPRTGTEEGAEAAGATAQTLELQRSERL